MNQEEKDKILRQKLENFAPLKLPRSTWQPEQTWEKLAPQLASKPKAKVIILRRVTYMGIAASLLILLGMWATLVNPSKENSTLSQRNDTESTLMKEETNLAKQIAEDEITLLSKKQKDEIAEDKEDSFMNDLPMKARALTNEKELANQIDKPLYQKVKKQKTKLKILENQPVELVELEQDFEITQEMPQPSLVVQNTTKETKPQEIILLVSKEAQKKKIGLFIGKRNKLQTTETNDSKKRNRGSIRLNESTESSMQANNLQGEIALLKVKLK